MVVVDVEGVLVWLEEHRDEGEEGVWVPYLMWGHQAGSQQEVLDKGKQQSYTETSGETKE